MIRRPPRSTRTDTLFPYTTSSDLLTVGDVAQGLENRPGSGRVGFPPDGGVGLLCMVAKGETAKRDEGRMGGSFRAAKGDGVGKSVGEEGGAIDGGTVFRRQAYGGGPFDRCPRGDRLEGQQPASLTRNPGQPERSEAHTSELQSLMRISYAGF